MRSVEKQRVTPIADMSRGDAFPPGTTIARYRIVSLIGSGAMGDVYRAHDRMLDREVALKVLPPELVHDRERVRRFAQEARAASALSHPHIVTIHEVGHARPSAAVQPIAERTPRRGSEVHYIAMELVDGKTLRETLNAALPLRRLIELLAEVADGLGKAHAAGIIHRDLKPENIIVSTDGYAKIVDFGLAKLVDPDRGWNPIGADSPTLRAMTQNGEVLGTPGYMSPEQITSNVVDQRADVFSFGCILYEAITHARPFEAESFVDTLYKILHEEPAPITAFVPDAAPELQRVVTKCLAKNRDERYQSIRDAAIDLREWLHQCDAAEAPRRSRASQVQLIAVGTIVAALPVLAWIFLGHRGITPAPQLTMHRVTSDGRTPIAAISPDARYIAYVSADGRGGSVWIQQLETKSTLQLVPPSNGHYVSVSFSRDGNYVYFVRYDTNLMADLWRVPMLGGKPEKLLHDIDTKPALSPDGSHIAFVRDDFNRSTSTLYVANGNGGGERAVSTFKLPDRAYSPAWSPDGAHLAIAQKTKLFEIAWPDAEKREIATHPRLAFVRAAAWSDASTLVVAAIGEESSHTRLWSVDTRSGSARPLTDDLNDLTNPSVSDDGRTIAAVQTIRQANLFAYDANGIRQITSGVASNGLSGIAWLGDRVLYTSAADGTSGLSLADAKSGASTKLSDGVIDTNPVASPDGTTTVFASTAKNQTSIWRMQPDGSERRQLTTGPRDGDFAISPDSKTLTWASVDARSTEWSLWSMPLSGGAAHKIASRPTLIEQIRYTPDGRTILFTSYAKDMLRLYRVPASGGTITELTTRRSWDTALSSDGKTLACSYDFDKSESASLALMPVDGSGITTLPLKGSHYRWCGDAITFLRDENGTTNLYRLEDGKPHRLTDFSEGSIVDYAWNADGTRAAITHVVDSADVVVIRR